MYIYIYVYIYIHIYIYMYILGLGYFQNDDRVCEREDVGPEKSTSTLSVNNSFTIRIINSISNGSYELFDFYVSCNWSRTAYLFILISKSLFGASLPLFRVSFRVTFRVILFRVWLGFF
jgi:hypothetical protein